MRSSDPSSWKRSAVVDGRSLVPLVDLHAQRLRLGTRIGEALAAVVAHGKFILGPEVDQLERELAARCHVSYAVTCASGTDALVLALLAWDVRAGDAVFVPAFTFAATAEAVVRAGAVPVFVDVDADTFAIEIGSVRAAVGQARRLGLAPVGVIAVDLFGQPADYCTLRALAAEEGLWLLADAAQSFGAAFDGRRVGSLASATATSFFPAKPLGCYGDGGAVLVDDAALADRLRSLRSHGQGQDKYENVLVGLNSRLDTLQAAVLLAKLTVFDDELVERQRVADRYANALGDVVQVPTVAPGAVSAWAAYTVRTPARDGLRRHLQSLGIASAVYYPRALHQQPAYHRFPAASGGLPISERLATEVLSLPMHPYLSPGDQDRVIDAVRAFTG